ncbi:MAG: hypothetical protein ABEK17_02810, partial [Candidatus Aenigmatarchaeota archaeon]
SEGMLAIARDKVSSAILFKGSMNNFELKEDFDMIICVYDTINHLLDFDEWEETFKAVSSNLKNDGIFIFDYNTPEKIDKVESYPPQIKKVNDDFVIINTSSSNDEMIWKVEIFEEIVDNKYELNEQEIRERSFDRQKINNSLKNFFSQINFLPGKDTDLSKSKRIYVVCQK